MHIGTLPIIRCSLELTRCSLSLSLSMLLAIKSRLQVCANQDLFTIFLFMASDVSREHDEWLKPRVLRVTLVSVSCLKQRKLAADNFL